MGKCKYCGQNATAGQSCFKSPSKWHVVDNGPKKCIYCGQNATAGQSCFKNPSGGHVLGA